MTRCRRCGWYYKNIRDWLYHQYDHKNGRTRKPWSKRRNPIQEASGGNDRKGNS